MKFYEITDNDKELIKVALSTLQNNFDDGIYRHTVGAALSCPNGKIYSGVNCDGIHGSCAEYITIGMAISAGERDFDTIVAVHDKSPKKISGLKTQKPQRFPVFFMPIFKVEFKRYHFPKSTFGEDLN